MIEQVWDYCNRNYENHGYIPDVEEVIEALHHHLTPEEIDDAHNTIRDFIACSSLKGVKVNYNGEGTRRVLQMKKCACHHKEIKSGEVVIVENGFYFCTRKDLIEMIKTNPHQYADMLLSNGTAEYKEVI